MKKTYKILPLSIYDIPGIESWLEEQANVGLFPVFLNTLCMFTGTGIPGTRFRLIAKKKREEQPSLEQLELCEEVGWQYAFSVADIYFLFYSTNPEAREFYTDWESRGFSLEPLKKQIASYRRRKVLIYSLLVAAIIWILFFHESTYDIQPDHFTQLPLILLNLFQPTVLLFLACAIWIWRQDRRDEKMLNSIYQALMQGVAPPTSKGPSKTIVREEIVMVALILPLAVSLVVNCVDALKPWINIPLERFSKTYISLQDIEREAVFPWEKLFAEEPFGGKTENYAEKKFSFLAPTWYSVTQEAYSPQSGLKENYFSPKPEHGVERYAPNLEATYFELWIPALARPVAKAQMDAYRLVNLEWSYAELDFSDLDFAIYATEPDGIWQMLAIGRANRVAVFRYAGMEQLPDHLKVLSEAVKESLL